MGAAGRLSDDRAELYKDTEQAREANRAGNDPASEEDSGAFHQALITVEANDTEVAETGQALRCLDGPPARKYLSERGTGIEMHRM